jgi:hypothetical protein
MKRITVRGIKGKRRCNTLSGLHPFVDDAIKCDGCGKTLDEICKHDRKKNA